MTEIENAVNYSQEQVDEIDNLIDRLIEETRPETKDKARRAVNRFLEAIAYIDSGQLAYVGAVDVLQSNIGKIVAQFDSECGSRIQCLATYLISEANPYAINKVLEIRGIIAPQVKNDELALYCFEQLRRGNIWDPLLLRWLTEELQHDEKLSSRPLISS